MTPSIKFIQIEHVQKARYSPDLQQIVPYVYWRVRVDDAVPVANISDSDSPWIQACRTVLSWLEYTWFSPCTVTPETWFMHACRAILDDYTLDRKPSVHQTIHDWMGLRFRPNGTFEAFNERRQPPFTIAIYKFSLSECLWTIVPEGAGV